MVHQKSFIQKAVNIKALSGRSILTALSLCVALIALLPIVFLLFEGINGFLNGSLSLNADSYKQIKGTLVLLLGTSIFGGILGTVNGWILANCRFPARRRLKVAQLLPLATPSYLLSATLIDLGSIYSIRIHGMIWAIIVMSLTTYPYVFLLSTESFSISGQRQLEACRSLGVGPWNSFRRIALPIALPAIGAGIALMGMEVINELGAVQLLNIPSISGGIDENWNEIGNPSGAIALSMIALAIVMILVAYEKKLRSRSRRWTEGLAGGEAPEWELKGIRAVLAQTLGFLPPALTLGVPLLWTFQNLDQLSKFKEHNPDIIDLTLRSLGLGIAAAIFTVLFSLILALAKRWNQGKLIKGLAFLSGLGYAIPGTVLAIGLFSFATSPLKLSPLWILAWGYSVRFLAVSKGGLDAAFERISPNLDEAATGLGSRWPNVVSRIHLPLLKGPLAVGALLVFVDTIKELPLTFSLRSYDFDTLSVRIYQYAGDGRIGLAILPALIILTLGLIASATLIPSLEQDFNLNPLFKCLYCQIKKLNKLLFSN